MFINIGLLHTRASSRGRTDLIVFTAEKRDLVKTILIEPGHVCRLSTQSICLRDTNDCNLTAIEEDCNELVTVCLMWACCSKVGRNNQRNTTIFSLGHYVQWQQWRLMSREAYELLQSILLPFFILTFLSFFFLPISLWMLPVYLHLQQLFHLTGGWWLCLVPLAVDLSLHVVYRQGQLVRLHAM